MEPSSLIQFLSYAAIFLSTIFIPLLASELGANAVQVGLVVSAYFLFYLISNLLFGYLSDRWGGRVFLRAGLLLAALTFGLQVLASNLPSLFLVRIFAGFSAGIFPAALAVYAYEARSGKMGKFTGYGALGWAMGSVIAAVAPSYPIIFVLSGLFFLFAFSLSLGLENIPRLPAAGGIFPWRILHEFRHIYYPYLLRNIGANAIWAVFPLYLIQLGADKFWVGIVYFTNTFAQFLIMQYVEKFRNTYLINFGLIASAFTFLAFALAPSFLHVMPIQILLAISYSTLQVGAIQELLRKSAAKSSSVGLLNSLVNLSAVLGPLFAGFVAHSFGFQGVMYFGLLLALIGFVIWRMR